MAKKDASPFGMEALQRFSTTFAADYRFGPLNILLLLLLCLAGLGLHLAVRPFQLGVVIDMLAVALSLAFLMRLTQVWETALLFTTVSALYLYLRHRPESDDPGRDRDRRGLRLARACRWPTSGSAR